MVYVTNHKQENAGRLPILVCHDHRRFSVTTTLLCAVVLLLPDMFTYANAQEPRYLVPPQENIAGRSQEEWSRLWWEWAGSFIESDGPVVDRTGAKCHLKQKGPVWFLAGTYGTRRTIRSCTIPRGKYVFFPLINYVVFPRNLADPPDCADVMNTARRNTDGAQFLVLKLDGVAATNLASYRQATSTCFDLAARADGAKKLFPSAANGYYAMLRPLPPGKYELDFGGILPSLVQAVTYRLVVQ